MSPLALVAAGGALLATPGLLRRYARRLPPHTWARVATGFLVAGLAALELGLIMAALPNLLRAAGFGELAAMCERSFGRLTAGGTALAWTSGAAAILLPASATFGWVRARRSQRRIVVEPWVGHHEDRGNHEVVVVPTSEPLAATTPGPPPQVLLSQGLLSRLISDDLEVVLRHEEAHLRNGHFRYLRAIGALEAVRPLTPLCRAGIASLRGALERWADEDAARSTAAGRPGVREALLRVAGTAACPAIPAFGAEAVADRVDALARPSHVTPLAWMPVAIPAVVTFGVATFAAAHWLRDVQMVLGTTGICVS